MNAACQWPPEVHGGVVPRTKGTEVHYVTVCEDLVVNVGREHVLGGKRVERVRQAPWTDTVAVSLGNCAWTGGVCTLYPPPPSCITQPSPPSSLYSPQHAYKLTSPLTHSLTNVSHLPTLISPSPTLPRLNLLTPPNLNLTRIPAALSKRTAYTEGNNLVTAATAATCTVCSHPLRLVRQLDEWKRASPLLG